MHMADALLSPTVGVGMCAISAASIGYSVYKMNKEDVSEKKLPLMAVSGAFVFAAQMINFTIPATGSSGHIGGGILLAALLGQYPSLLTLAAVLIIQCLFFADGGLLALGANIFNMGVIPCLIIYPLLFKPLLKKGFTKKNVLIASVLSCVVGLQLGAFGVVLETLFSGITSLPFQTFVMLMQPIHLAIGFVEGLITSVVLMYVHSAAPQIVESGMNHSNIQVSIKKVVAVLAVCAILIGGGLSLYASSFPDGLEWSIEKVTGSTEVESQEALHESMETIQESTSFMPDYDFKEGEGTGTSVAGLVGGAMTCALAGLAGAIIYFAKKKSKEGA
ncbi:MAG: energy-coupling factor ABC transporter permease [Firmicutes bacterium]|nr:energy-coupling factor ABC transporter permease [Bacillota bacterium]